MASWQWVNVMGSSSIEMWELAVANLCLSIRGRNLRIFVRSLISRCGTDWNPTLGRQAEHFGCGSRWSRKCIAWDELTRLTLHVSTWSNRACPQPIRQSSQQNPSDIFRRKALATKIWGLRIFQHIRKPTFGGRMGLAIVLSVTCCCRTGL